MLQLQKRKNLKNQEAFKSQLKSTYQLGINERTKEPISMYPKEDRKPQEETLQLKNKH